MQRSAPDRYIYLCSVLRLEQTKQQSEIQRRLAEPTYTHVPGYFLASKAWSKTDDLCDACEQTFQVK